MQSQSVILLAEVRHSESQAEAARNRIVNQACAHRASPIRGHCQRTATIPHRPCKRR